MDPATLLELLGLVCFLALAWLVWPPLVLGVLGAACLAAARARGPRPRS